MDSPELPAGGSSRSAGSVLRGGLTFCASRNLYSLGGCHDVAVAGCLLFEEDDAWRRLLK